MVIFKSQLSENNCNNTQVIIVHIVNVSLAVNESRWKTGWSGLKTHRYMSQLFTSLVITVSRNRHQELNLEADARKWVWCAVLTQEKGDCQHASLSLGRDYSENVSNWNLPEASLAVAFGNSTGKQLLRDELQCVDVEMKKEGGE